MTKPKRGFCKLGPHNIQSFEDQPEFSTPNFNPFSFTDDFEQWVGKKNIIAVTKDSVRVF